MEKIIQSEMGEIKLRPLGLEDVEAQMDYLYNSPREFLESIGFDVDKLPGREKHTKVMREKIKERQALPLVAQKYMALVAEFKNKPIALVVLNPDDDGEEAHAHFHIWDESLRGKGLGSLILKSGLKLLLKHQKRSSALIEPHEENERMNRLMEKCGFEFIEKCIFSGAVTLEFPANRYKIVAEDL